MTQLLKGIHNGQEFLSWILYLVLIGKWKSMGWRRFSPSCENAMSNAKLKTLISKINGLKRLTRIKSGAIMKITFKYLVLAWTP